MSLESTSDKEFKLLAEMPDGGSFEERDKFLSDHGLYNRWAVVFEEYVELAKAGDIESLKRALFFSWYRLAEPGILSGLKLLSEGSVEIIIELTDKLAQSKSLDEELSYMIPFYFQVCDYYFEPKSRFTSLLFASNSNHDLWQEAAARSHWQKRGIMGEYWQSKGGL